MSFQMYIPEQAIDFDLRKSLNSKISRLKSRAFSEELITERYSRQINQESLSHSYNIENQSNEYRRCGRTQNDSPDVVRENFVLLNEAWNFTKTLNFSKLSLNHLIDINRILEPSSQGIRLNTAIIFGSEIIRSKGPKLISQLEESIEFANSLEPIDQSIFLHQRLLYLHPFSDGNGRSIRMYSNGILNNIGSPSFLIPSGERNFYFSLLENSYISFKERKATGKNDNNLSREEITLYGYLASKINSSLDSIIDELDKSKRTSIQLSFKRNPNKGYSTFKQRLQTLISKRNLPATLEYVRENKDIKSLIIKGDISPQILGNILDSMEGLKDFEIKNLK